MIYFGICELLKHWKQTLLMALQIGFIMFLAVAAVTSYRAQTEKYRYIKDFLHKDGVLMWGTALNINSPEETEAYLESIGVDECHDVSKRDLYLDETWENSLSLYAYDELLDQYEPMLSEGVWFTKADKTEGVIEAVVSKNRYGIGLDDVVDMHFYGEPVKVHVCGVLAEETSVYGASNGLSIYDSFFDLYGNFDSAREDTEGLIFLSAEELEKVIGYPLRPMGKTLLSFKDDISDTAKKNILLDWQNKTIVIDFETLRERTESEINSKMAEILPVFIGAFFLVILSVACLSAIDTMTSIRSYAIFFTCGMKWKKGMYISAVKSILTCFIGIVVMFLLYYISIFTKLNETILFELGPWQILACVIVCLFMVVISCIMPRQILKNNQPANVLRESRQ